MKVLCPHCERLISLETFRVDGPALIITCARCGAESRVENVSAAAASGQTAQTSQASSPPRPASLPPRISLASTEGGSNVVVLRTAGHEAVQKAAKAADEGPFILPDGVCPKCIGSRSNGPSCKHCGILFESFDESAMPMPKWLREEWVALLRDWGNEPKHVALRRKAQQLEGLAAVGRLYRVRQSFVPEDPFAAEGRADVLRLAAMAINIRPPVDESAARRKQVVLVGVVAVFFFLAVLTLVMQIINQQ